MDGSWRPERAGCIFDQFERFEAQSCTFGWEYRNLQDFYYFTLLHPDSPGTYGIPLVPIGILRLASLETTLALNDAFGANVTISMEFLGFHAKVCCW